MADSVYGATPQRRTGVYTSGREQFNRPQSNTYSYGHEGNYTGTRTQENTMGGSPKPPKMPKQATAMETAQAQDWAAQQEFNRNQQLAKEKAAADEAAKQGRIATTQGDVARIFGQGQEYGTSQLGSLGYNDDYGILSRYNQSLNNARTRVPSESTDVGSFFNYADMWNSAMNEATNAQRGKLDTQYRGMIKPGWQQNYFADTEDDPILDAILAQQKGDVTNTLKANMSRGQMSEGAYNYALNRLGQQAQGARSTLEDIGGGVLGRYRDDLGNIANQFGDQITNYKLGQQVNTGDLGGQLTARQGALRGRLPGDIYKAVGNTELFDTDALIARAGAAAGPANTPLGQAFQNNPLAVAPQDRTTGTTGIF